MSGPAEDMSQKIFTSFPHDAWEGVTLPPPSFVTKQTRTLAYEPRTLLRSAYATPVEYANPAGALLGGYLSSLFDNTMGMLGYAAAGRPIITLHLSTTFIRPIVPPEPIEIEARVVSAGRSVVTIEASAYNAKGKLLATAQTVNQVVRQPPAEI